MIRCDPTAYRRAMTLKSSLFIRSRLSEEMRDTGLVFIQAMRRLQCTTPSSQSGKRLHLLLLSTSRRVKLWLPGPCSSERCLPYGAGYHSLHFISDPQGHVLQNKTTTTTNPVGHLFREGVPQTHRTSSLKAHPKNLTLS